MFNSVELSQIKIDGAVIIKRFEYVVQIGKPVFWKAISFADFQSLPAKYAYVPFSTIPNSLIFSGGFGTNN